ncbi:MAG: hypothetical protein JYX80_14825 [Candidatus Scalindua sediminis]|nr:hypothetical protein [Candidatus Scalindua sediminis]
MDIIKKWGCFAIEITIRQKAKADGYLLLVIRKGWMQEGRLKGGKPAKQTGG